MGSINQWTACRVHLLHQALQHSQQHVETRVLTAACRVQQELSNLPEDACGILEQHRVKGQRKQHNQWERNAHFPSPPKRPATTKPRGRQQQHTSSNFNSRQVQTADAACRQTDGVAADEFVGQSDGMSTADSGWHAQYQPAEHMMEQETYHDAPDASDSYQDHGTTPMHAHTTDMDRELDREASLSVSEIQPVWDAASAQEHEIFAEQPDQAPINHAAAAEEQTNAPADLDTATAGQEDSQAEMDEHSSAEYDSYPLAREDDDAAGQQDPPVAVVTYDSEAEPSGEQSLVSADHAAAAFKGACMNSFQRRADAAHPWTHVAPDSPGTYALTMHT